MSRNLLAIRPRFLFCFLKVYFGLLFFSFLISGTESEMSRSTVKEQNWGSLDLNL